MTGALVAGSVPEEGYDDPVVALHLASQSRAHGHREGGSDDAGLAQDADVEVGKVHRASLALTVAGGLAQKLGHCASHVATLGDWVTVRAVVPGDVVVIAERSARANGDCFLADVAVGHAHKLASPGKLLHVLLELANKHHPPEHQHVDVTLLVHFGLP